MRSSGKTGAILSSAVCLRRFAVSRRLSSGDGLNLIALRVNGCGLVASDRCHGEEEDGGTNTSVAAATWRHCWRPEACWDHRAGEVRLAYSRPPTPPDRDISAWPSCPLVPGIAGMGITERISQNASHNTATPATAKTILRQAGGTARRTRCPARTAGSSTVTAMPTMTGPNLAKSSNVLQARTASPARRTRRVDRGRSASGRCWQ